MDHLLGLITFINCFSVKLATKVQNIFTAAKLVAIAIIIAGGLYMIGIGKKPIQLFHSYVICIILST